MNKISRFINAICWGNINLKMKLILFCGFTLSPITLLVAGEHLTRPEINNVLALWICISIALLLPISNLCSQLLALRPIKELNRLCLEIKSGHLASFAELPPEPRNEEPLQVLKHNMFWMGHVLASRQRILTTAKASLEEAQRQNQQAIEYAERIQHAFLTGEEELQAVFKDYFLLWEQRDGVGGDFYWVKKSGKGFWVAVVDCTGHGVPGAFMTLIVQSLLQQVDADHFEGDPAALLKHMSIQIRRALTDDSYGDTNDGMDCTIIYVDNQRQKLTFAGARNSLFIRSPEGEVREIKGDRRGVGNDKLPKGFAFTNHTVEITDGMRFYTLTDGILDQIGGEKHLPFGKKRFKTFIAETNTPLHTQKTSLLSLLTNYQNRESRRDDVMVLGFTF